MNDLKNFWNSRKRVDKIALVTTSVIALIVIVALASSPKGSKDTKSTAKPATTATTSESQTTVMKTVTTSQKILSKTVTTSEKPVTEAQRKALDYIDKHGADANRVQAYVLIVQIAVLDLRKHSTQAKVDALAIAAQDAHDGIDALRNNFADSGSDAQMYVFMGANDLKNSMGALVDYAGTPNAATLAHFHSQYTTARAEWNNGVRSIWRAAKRKPPIV